MKNRNTIRVKIAAILIFSLLLQPGIRVSATSSVVSGNSAQVSSNSANRASSPQVTVTIERDDREETTENKPVPTVTPTPTPAPETSKPTDSTEDEGKVFSLKRLTNVLRAAPDAANAPDTSNDTDWQNYFTWHIDTSAGNHIVLEGLSSNNTSENITIPEKAVIDGVEYTPMFVNASRIDKGIFYNKFLLKTIDISNVDTSKMTDMSGLFYNCRELVSLSMGSIDTSSVENMNSMFSDCKKLTSIDLSSFDTRNVRTMENMFSDCSALTNLDVSNFDTSNVTNMTRMFSGCSDLTSLDLSGFDAGSATNMTDMFDGCSDLIRIDVPKNVKVVAALPATFVNSTDEDTEYTRLPDTTSPITIIRKDAYTPGPPDPSKVVSVSLNKTELTLEADQDETLIATVNPDTAAEKGVTWESSNESIATVDSNGKVTGLSTGVGKKAKITVKTLSENKTDTCWVWVVEKQIHVTDVSVSSDYTVEQGTSKNISGDVSITPSNATNKRVTYTSSDPDTVFVTQQGLVWGRQVGEAFITVTSVDNENAKDRCKVTVESVPVTGITLNKQDLTLYSNGYIGDAEMLSANIIPSNATNKKVIWESRNPRVATVASDGTVVAKEFGETEIIAKSDYDNDIKATCRVKVLEKLVSVNKITVSPTSNKILVGDSFTVDYMIDPPDATDQRVEWSSDAPNTASVSRYGTVTGIAPGTATITVKTRDGGKTASCTVIVEARPVEVEKITLDPPAWEMYVGEEKAIIPTIIPGNATDKTLKWKTNNASVATVTSSGVITGVGLGSAIITAVASNGVNAVCPVTVKKLPVRVKEMYVSPLNKTIYVGEAFNIIATILPADADVKDILWTSDKADVATVDDTGRVLGKSIGEAVITATTVDGGITADCKVTVINRPAPKPTPTPPQYKLYINDQRNNNAPNKDKVRGTVETLAGDRYLIITDSDGNILKPRINGDSSLEHHKAVYMDIRITDSSGNDKTDFGKCTIRIPLISEMDLKNGTVRVVAVNGDGIDKSISSSTGTEDGVSYVTFTSGHFCQYAILYRLNQSVIDYYNNPYYSLANLYNNAYAANLNKTRVLDYVPRTGIR